MPSGRKSGMHRPMENAAVMEARFAGRGADPGSGGLCGWAGEGFQGQST